MSLERVSHLVFIVSALVMIGFAIDRYRGDNTRQNGVFRGAQDDPMPIGSSVGNWDAVTSGNSARTAVLVLRSTCIFCTESMPFYRQLSEFRSPERFALVVLSPEPDEVTRRYLASHSLLVDAARRHTGAEIPTRATPTLVLVDRTGRVEKSWLGKLNSDQQEELLRRLQG